MSQEASLTRFHQAVLSAMPVDAPGPSGARLWTLAGMHWPYLQQRVLLQRDFYDAFLTSDAWLGRLPRGGPQRKVIVLGQPGIGKSSFGLWLLAQLLRDGRTVVYSRNSSQRRLAMDHVIFHRGVAFETDLDDIGPAKHLLSSRDVVHICDSCEPRQRSECHKVLITSPDPTVWSWFHEKDGAIKAVFPLYSDAELETLREAEFGNSLSAPEMNRRVAVWGPVPRQVFASDQSTVLSSVVRAIRKCSVIDLERAWEDVQDGSAVATDDSPHSLFLLHAERALLKPGDVTFRSATIAARILRYVAKYQYRDLLAMMLRLLDSGSARSTGGKLFEVLALDALRSGGSYKIRPLVFYEADKKSARKRAVPPSLSGDQSALVLPAARLTQPFQTLADITAGSIVSSNDSVVLTRSLDTHRFVPVVDNWASVDSIEVGLRLMQMTTSRSSHCIKVTSGRSHHEGLAAIARELLRCITSPHAGGWNSSMPKLEVFFVMPSDKFTFEAQNLDFYPLAAGATAADVAWHGSVRAGPDVPVQPGVTYNKSFMLTAHGVTKQVVVMQYALELPLERSMEGFAPQVVTGADLADDVANHGRQAVCR